jgi:hypothetical protein
VIDPVLTGLLMAVADGDLEAVLVLSDWLEDRGDPRAAPVRQLYVKLYDTWVFAPLSFRFYRVGRQLVWPLFPEHPGDEGVKGERDHG